MTVEELIGLVEKIQKFETEFQTIEVKKAHGGCPEKLYDTLSSFSNQNEGGIIVFGLDENNQEQRFKCVGVYDANDLQKQVMEQCRQMVPPVRAVFQVAEFDEGKVVSAEIPPVSFVERPCYYSGQGRAQGSYIRVGDGDLKMTDFEIYSYEAFREHVHDDIRLVDDAERTDLNEDLVQKYIVEKKKERPDFSRLPEERILALLGIIKKGKITLAALLNFGIYPQGAFPQYAVTAVVVPGKQIGETTTSGARFLDNRRFEGPLSEMVESSVDFCRRNMRTQTIIQDGRRTDKVEYPINAIREAILNGLIHRDYSIYSEGTTVQIYLFTDRLEVHSPGLLYGSATVAMLGYERVDLRNPTLCLMAETMTSAESRYSGIPTMRLEMQEAGLPEPEFINNRKANEFIVIFRNSRKANEAAQAGSGKVGDKEEQILQFCRTPRTKKEIAEHLQISSVAYVMRRYIRPLLESGKMCMTNPAAPQSHGQKYCTNYKK